MMEDPELNRLTALLAYVQTDGRVCPMPDAWTYLWMMLPRHEQEGSFSHLPPPLILGAWWCSSALSKNTRLTEHIRFAAAHGALAKVDEYVRNLPPTAWAYGDGTEDWTVFSQRKTRKT